MANVTYYLGAGASANALPTYANFENRFQHFAHMLSGIYDYISFSQREKEEMKGLYNKLMTYSEELKYHNTPDTLAKKLFHKNEYEFVEFKKILILFFIYQQMFGIKKAAESTEEVIHEIDKRYDTLLASILKPIRSKVDFLGNFNIITWNYDLQFELAISRYLDKDIYEVSKYVNVYPDILDRKPIQQSEFSIVHLNGICYCEAEGITHPFMKVEKLEEGVRRILSLYNYLKKGRGAEVSFGKLMEFAWEKYSHNFSVIENDNLKAAIKIAEQTEVLIIVGYSFPIFNSSVDELIFKSMPNLKKIYVQTKDSQLINQLRNSDLHECFMSPDSLIELGFTNQFHIPFEWNKDVSNISSNQAK